MLETPPTVVGHIVNDLQRRVGDQEVVKFRVAIPAPAHQRRSPATAVYHRHSHGEGWSPRAQHWGSGW